MGSPYPLLVLCSELNKLVGEECIYLPGHMQSLSKDSAYFFQPSDYVARGFSNTDIIPDRLVNDLLDVLQSEKTGRDQLRNLLSQWWKASAGTLSYQCPFPAEWLDRGR